MEYEENNLIRDNERILKEDTLYFSVLCLVYGIFAALCFYQNKWNSIMSVLFSMVTITVFYLGIMKFKQTLKKDTKYYMAAILLIGISNFMTESVPIVVLNFLVLLMLIFTNISQTAKRENSREVPGLL